MLAMILYVTGLTATGAASGNPSWLVMYDGGFQAAGVAAWVSDLTRSEKTPEGLHIVDPSTAAGSGRFYHLDWRVNAQAGATVEARLKAVSCSQPWGSSLLVSDGVHEEGVTFFPDQVMLASTNLTAPFDAAKGFHTFRILIQRTNIQVWADGKLLLDGTGKFTSPANERRNRVGFGCGSSTATGEAVWQFVRFQGGGIEQLVAAGADAPSLDVRVGQTRTIVPNAHYVSMFQFADGSIVVGEKRSWDAGRTWKAARSFHVGACQLPDGETIQLGFLSKKTPRDGYFEIPLIRSTDNGLTARSDTAVLHIPDATGGTGDDGKPYEGPPADHAIVRLRDGSLLAAMYGQFKSDRVLVPTMPAQWRCFKYRTWVIRSTDRGKSWEYLSTVAYDPSIGLESFCEADLLVLRNGDILCFMRTGGSGGGFTPLHLSRSTDDGRTWSKPTPIADRGVWPNACRMRNGVLVCTYGRPGNWLCFSLDEGRTWTGHFCFYEGRTTSYNSVEEVAPDTLLVVYDRMALDDNGNVVKGVAGTYVTARRK